MTFLATLAVLSLAANLALGIALAYVLTQRRTRTEKQAESLEDTAVLPVVAPVKHGAPKPPAAANRGAVALPVLNFRPDVTTTQRLSQLSDWRPRRQG